VLPGRRLRPCTSPAAGKQRGRPTRRTLLSASCRSAITPDGRAERLQAVHAAKLIVAVGQKIDVPVTLAIGQMSESITITAEPPLLQDGKRRGE